MTESPDNNKSANGHSGGTMMTIQEQPSSTIMTTNYATSTEWFGAIFRPFGFGGEMRNHQKPQIPNCVYANWPVPKQKTGDESEEDEERRIFVNITSAAASAENGQKTVHFHLEQDIGLERRIISIPAHILRWIGFEPGDEVSIQLNNDLSRGFSVEKENLSSASYTISRLQIQVQLLELKEVSKLSLRADSLADYFRQTFLNDVLNVGQFCLLECECATKSEQQQNGRKTKCVEMRQKTMLTPNDLKTSHPQHEGPFNILLKWTGFGGVKSRQQNERKYTIEAKILALYRQQSINSDTKAQFGLVKEATQVFFCPVPESGLCLYGDPVFICSTSIPAEAAASEKPSTSANNAVNEGIGTALEQINKVIKTIEVVIGGNDTNDDNRKYGENAGKIENAKIETNAVKSLKLNVQKYDTEMWSGYDDSCLVHQQDYNVVTKTFTAGLASSAITPAVAITNSYTQKSNILIKCANKSNANIKERQVVWSAINQTDYSIYGERGKIFLTEEIMDHLKIENGDEVTIETFDGDQTAKQIKLEFKQCDGGAKCPQYKQGFLPSLRGHKKNSTSFFHANDIINSFKKTFSGKILNSNIKGYLSVDDEEIRNRMKDFKTNLFDEGTHNNSSACIQFKITEIQVSKKIEPKSASTATAGISTTNIETTNSENNQSSSTATQIAEKTTSDELIVENVEFATIKKDTTIELECADPNLTIFGVEGQSSNASQKLFDKNGWNLSKKVGGLDKQLGEIFRRAFSSRMISADCSKQMGIKHIRGILLHGPPGTGKTLIARELAKALNSREPKIIHGAEVLNMWLGQSEKNVRSLFVDAEREQALAGDQSRLHVIIIDELDALCPNRQNAMSSHRTEQRIVNTLLAKLDGVEQLNNILLIGMTNLMETIDPALLRPGRLELKIHIGLPNEKGRCEILEIHTKTMREAKRLHEDVDLANLAKKTVNFSGAELEGLVRAAQSQAIERILKVKDQQKEGNEENENGEKELKTSLSPSNASLLLDDSELRICAADFELAFEKDIQPAFGKGSMDGAQLMAILCREPILWSPKIEKLLQKGSNLAMELQTNNARAIGHSRVMLLNGPRQSGKTFLATTIAQSAGIPYIRLVTADSMHNSSNQSGKKETTLLDNILSDCENTDFACIIFDELEQIIEYNESHQNWNHTILRKLKFILDREPSKGKRMLLLATSCEKPEWFEQMHLHSCLQHRVELPTIGKCEDVISVFGAATRRKFENVETKLFNNYEMDEIAKVIGPELGSANAKVMPTMKDLAKLIDWYSNECVEAEFTELIPIEEPAENDDNMAASPSFEKFKQRLLQLIAQKRASANNFVSHLSMYR